MIVVDTSVWISVLRMPESPHAETLRALLDADEVALPVAVRSELLLGVTGGTRQRLRNLLSALPVLYPTDDTWRVLDEWTERAGERGHQFGLGDLLIGVLASDVGALVWSLDQDFARMEELKMVRLYG